MIVRASPVGRLCAPERARAVALTRRELGAMALAATLMPLVTTSPARAQSLAMPADLEAKLSGKVAAYERGFTERAGDKVVVAILAKRGDSESARAAMLMHAAFRDLEDIGGLPHEESILQWDDPSTLTQACRQRKVTIVYVAPGLERDIASIVASLEPLAVLSVAGALSYVEQGIVVGFDLVSGRPKVVLNLATANKQKLRFRSDLLNLARIIA